MALVFNLSHTHTYTHTLAPGHGAWLDVAPVNLGTNYFVGLAL
jgi:hypothetical protein